ncbi:MAG TPA: hypothetical protein VK765_03445 [Solirubrobacteraceae bacterium]|jgi:hypothetical protein|nr:hypothetical protein [Solirubrobacteraceae bacterium]
MSDPDDTQREATAESNGVGVLANLPRTRPQRSSPRRAAARASSAAAGPSKSNASKPNTSKPNTSKAGASKASPSKASPNKASPNKASPSKASPSKAAPGKAAKGKAAKSKPIAGANAAEAAPAPRQGFESESEHSNRTVHPPGGAELVASVAEIVGEFAKAGLSTGERLLKDALSRLPLS